MLEVLVQDLVERPEQRHFDHNLPKTINFNVLK
jgi:hypothetical protein